MNETMVTQDPRFSVQFEKPDKFVLQIKNISNTDGGFYRCAVTLDSNSQEAKDINLLVRSAPTILQNTTTSIDAIEGSNDTKLECYVSDKTYPKPNLEWTRENNGPLPNGASSGQNVLKFSPLRKEDAGIYYCNAHNGVGPAVRKTFYLNVKFQPEIHVPVARIGQALQFKAELQCVVKAYPSPVIVWLKNSSQVENTQLVQVNTTAATSDTTISTLVITPTERSQYGTYTCRAKNERGRFEALVEFYETEHQECAPTCGSNFEYPNFKMIVSTALLVVLAFRW